MNWLKKRIARWLLAPFDVGRLQLGSDDVLVVQFNHGAPRDAMENAGRIVQRTLNIPPDRVLVIDDRVSLAVIDRLEADVIGGAVCAMQRKDQGES